MEGSQFNRISAAVVVKVFVFALVSENNDKITLI